MFYEKIKLMENSQATLTAYIPEVYKEIDENIEFEAVVVCPGGGYRFCSQREAEPIALMFLGEGKASFVLDYSVAPVEYPQALLEVSKAVAMIRENAKKWHINPDKIFVMGFSAGGHLAASLATMWQEEFIQKALNIPYGANKPNGAILCYAVVSSDENISHAGSFDNLLGEQNTPEMRKEMSLEHKVSRNTPPVFIWHTFEDQAVNVRNSFEFATACKKNDVPCEMHIFPHGGHGMSLCDSRTSKKGSEYATATHVGKWTKLCIDWINIQK